MSFRVYDTIREFVASMSRAAGQLAGYRRWLQPSHGGWLGSRLDHVQADPLDSLRLEFQDLGRAVGDIDDATGNHRAAIIDAYHNRPAVPQICDSNQCAKWQSRVGGGQVVHVVGLAARRGLTFKFFSVPRRGADLERLRVESRCRNRSADFFDWG